jgi:dihydrofolate reductase
MRKLKLQMQLSVDGYAAGPNGEMDWMTWNWGDDIKNYVKDLTAPVDTIIMGRKLAEGFIPHWKAYLDKPETRDEFSAKMVNTTKVVFSKTMQQSNWDNTIIAHDIVADVEELKNKPGGDIITYGGSSFAGALIKNNLVDEYHLFFNPAAIGTGMPIFNMLDSRLALQLANAEHFDCGIAVLCYNPAGK